MKIEIYFRNNILGGQSLMMAYNEDESQVFLVTHGAESHDGKVVTADHAGHIKANLLDSCCPRQVTLSTPKAWQDLVSWYQQHEAPRGYHFFKHNCSGAIKNCLHYCGFDVTQKPKFSLEIVLGCIPLLNCCMTTPRQILTLAEVLALSETAPLLPTTAPAAVASPPPVAAPSYQA